MNIITVLIQLAIIAVTVILAVILIINYAIRPVTVISEGAASDPNQFGKF